MSFLVNGSNIVTWAFSFFQLFLFMPFRPFKGLLLMCSNMGLGFGPPILFLNAEVSGLVERIVRAGRFSRSNKIIRSVPPCLPNDTFGLMILDTERSAVIGVQKISVCITKICFILRKFSTYILKYI